MIKMKIGGKEIEKLEKYIQMQRQKMSTSQKAYRYRCKLFILHFSCVYFPEKNCVVEYREKFSSTYKPARLGESLQTKGNMASVCLQISVAKMVICLQTVLDPKEMLMVDVLFLIVHNRILCYYQILIINIHIEFFCTKCFTTIV